MRDVKLGTRTVEVYTVPEKKVDGHNKMQALAERAYEYHTAPLPEAETPPIDPFPKGLVWGLWLSVLAGAVIGLIFGVLMQNNTIVIQGTEGLYSMTPFTFDIFWMLMGAALGLLIGGVVAILATPAERQIPERG